MIVAGGYNRRVQVRAAAKTSWSKARRGKFLVALAATCNVRHASATVGVSPRSAYHLRARDEEFAAAWAEAMAAGYARLEDELLARALGDPAAERLEAETGSDDGGGVQEAPRAFDVDLAFKLLAHRNAALRGSVARRGAAAPARVTCAALEMALLTRLDAIDRRLAREAQAAQRLTESQCERGIRDAVARDVAVKVPR